MPPFQACDNPKRDAVTSAATHATDNIFAEVLCVRQTQPWCGAQHPYTTTSAMLGQKPTKEEKKQWSKADSRRKNNPNKSKKQIGAISQSINNTAAQPGWSCCYWDLGSGYDAPRREDGKGVSGIPAEFYKNRKSFSVKQMLGKGDGSDPKNRHWKFGPTCSYGREGITAAMLAEFRKTNRSTQSDHGFFYDEDGKFRKGLEWMKNQVTQANNFITEEMEMLAKQKVEA